MLELEPVDDEEEDPPDVDEEELESLELEPDDEEVPSLLPAPPPSELEESDDFDPLRRP